MKYKIYFQINESKFKISVNAKNKEEAKLKILDKITIVKIEKELDPEIERLKKVFNIKD